jgi:catechol 2,3-dioxygenase-like lactoylglutathione lyase family enzyme
MSTSAECAAEEVAVASSSMDCCQIALSSVDLTRSHWWYRTALGFRTAGERRRRAGAHWAKVPGLPEASFDVWCLVGRQRFMQIEFFEFRRPRMRRLPPDRRLCDFGYSMVGIHVPRFDDSLERIMRVGGAPLTEPLGQPGERRVCLRDPDGILLELMEDPVLVAPDPSDSADSDQAHLPSIASVTVAVPDLDRVRAFWVDVLGFDELPATTVHQQHHEALWDLQGASRECAVLRAGEVALEFARYLEPVGRSRPAGHMISDQGVLNIALGSTSKESFYAVYERALAHGFQGHAEPWTLPNVATVVYLTDPQGLSVELLHVEPSALERMGFRAVDETQR